MFDEESLRNVSNVNLTAFSSELPISPGAGASSLYDTNNVAAVPEATMASPDPYLTPEDIVVQQADMGEPAELEPPMSTTCFRLFGFWQVFPAMLSAVWALIAPSTVDTTGPDGDCETSPLNWRLFFEVSAAFSFGLIIFNLTLHYPASMMRRAYREKRVHNCFLPCVRFDQFIIRNIHRVDLFLMLCTLACLLLGFFTWEASHHLDLDVCRELELRFQISIPFLVAQAVFIEFAEDFLDFLRMTLVPVSLGGKAFDAAFAPKTRGLVLPNQVKRAKAGDAAGGGPVADSSAAAAPAASATDQKAETKAKGKASNEALYVAVKRLMSDPKTMDMDARTLQSVVADMACGQFPDSLPEAPSAKCGPTPPIYEELTKVGLLGCGGFASVDLYRHESVGDQRGYALKTINKGYTVKSGMYQQLVVEKLVLMMARSPFVVRFHGSYNQPNHVVFVTDALLGGELYATYRRLELHGSEPHARYYCASIAMALNHLHGLHVLCRGVKPEDCVLDAAGRLKMVDMGIAKLMVERTYTTCGTPDYFAPEVIASSGHGFAYDWWALGCVAYETMAGAPPFESAYPMAIYSKVMKGIEQVTFHKNVKGPVKSFVLALLKKQPEQRLPMQEDGWNKLQKHPWFADFNWIGLEIQTDTPPYVPTVTGPCDLQNNTARDEDRPKDVDMAEGADSACEWETEFGAGVALSSI